MVGTALDRLRRDRSLAQAGDDLHRHSVFVAVELTSYAAPESWCSAVTR
jgi:hypothetical protein